jgi:hypothetical protein
MLPAVTTIVPSSHSRRSDHAIGRLAATSTVTVEAYGGKCV